jgi:membrane-bound serine protease (ClpP class)
MNRICLLCLLFVVIFSFGWSQEPPVAAKVVLSGFLGKEELTQIRSTLEGFQDEKGQPILVLEVNSSSGDLPEVLDVAKFMYELKRLKQLKVIVYIRDSAIGPAAIFPFLADELYISHFVSWGDIPLGSEGRVPTNILRNQVRSLISSRNQHASLLSVLADAMSDPNVQVIEDGDWRIVRDAKDNAYPLISGSGQTLVVNHNQLQDLKLVDDVLTPAQFKDLFQFSNSKAEDQDKDQKPATDPASQAIEDKLKKHIHIRDGENVIGHIVINDQSSGINQSTWLYVKNALDYYQKTQPIFVILELNTPGGEVFAAEKISDALKELDTQFNIPVVTFINNWAVSAGAMLAYSTRFITVVKDAIMGAAEPVYATQEGTMEAASEKVNSALRADFASRASFFGRNPLLAEAMVDKDMILVLRHGRIVRLDQENQIRTTGPAPDTVISPKGKLLTLNADQLMEYGVADLLLPPQKLAPITPEEERQGRWPADKMLLFHAPFFSDIPQATIDSYQMDWKTQFFVFLATPVVSSLLVMGLMIGAYMEMSTPGFGLPGTIAAICLFLILLSSFSLELAGWLEVIILLTGLALLIIELFILPSFGFVGIIGIFMFVGGLLALLLPGLGSVSFDYDSQTLNAAGQYFIERLVWFSGSLILSFIVIAFLGRYFLPHFSGFRRFVLSGNEQDASLGYVAGEDPQRLPAIGAEGEVVASLRPAGKVIVQNQWFDAVSTGDFIDIGEKIVVERLEGSTVFVKRLSNGDHTW